MDLYNVIYRNKFPVNARKKCVLKWLDIHPVATPKGNNLIARSPNFSHD